MADKEALEKLKGLNKQIREQRQVLTAATEEKRKEIKEIQALRDEIIQMKVGNKEKRGQISEHIEKHKKATQAIREASKQISALIEKVKTLERPRGRQNNASKITREIEHLEEVIETAGVSFEKERKMMSRIKELKKNLDDMQVDVGNVKDYNEVSSSITAKKKERQSHAKEADEISKLIDTLKKDIQQTSDSIKELEEKEKERNATIDKMNDRVKELSKNLKELQAESGKLNEHFTDKRKVDQQKEDRLQKETIKERVAEVNDKIKTGKKLTTEDFLLLQNASDS